MQVPLSDIVFPSLQPFIVPGQEDTLALTTSFRLNDEGLSLLIVELNLEIL